MLFVFDCRCRTKEIAASSSSERCFLFHLRLMVCLAIARLFFLLSFGAGFFSFFLRSLICLLSIALNGDDDDLEIERFSSNFPFFLSVGDWMRHVFHFRPSHNPVTLQTRWDGTKVAHLLDNAVRILVFFSSSSSFETWNRQIFGKNFTRIEGGTSAERLVWHEECCFLCQCKKAEGTNREKGPWNFLLDVFPSSARNLRQILRTTSPIPSRIISNLYHVGGKLKWNYAPSWRVNKDFRNSILFWCAAFLLLTTSNDSESTFAGCERKVFLLSLENLQNEARVRDWICPTPLYVFVKSEAEIL